MGILPKWYDCIEEPLQELVHILRNSGFNTICSCGHYPKPYIQLEWYDGSEDTRLWNLLTEKGFKNWGITTGWRDTGERTAEIIFYHSDWNDKKGLADLKDIHDIQSLATTMRKEDVL